MTLKKGSKVILKGFTGIKLGVFPVESVTKKTATVLKKNGDEMIFDLKTGKQVNVEEGKEKYANSIIEDDGSYVAPTRATKKTKKTSKKADPVVEDDNDEDEDDEEEEEAPAKKPAKKTASKKTKKVVEPEEEDDDDEFEEVDEDDED